MKQIINAVFEWLSGVVSSEDKILVELPGYRKIFYFEFPLRIGQKPKEIKGRLDFQDVTFIIRRPPKGRINQTNWRQIFLSPEIEILENKEKIKDSARHYFLISEEEKNILLKFVREVLEKFLLETEKSPGFCSQRILEESLSFFLPSKFFTRTCLNLDVAVWVNGRLRGSCVVENSRFLKKGLVEAAVGAARDSRFKPLVHNELSRARIEVTLMSDLRVSMGEDLFGEKRILVDKGYILQRGNSSGYFLPEVFNVHHFRGLTDFLEKLAREKAGLSEKAWHDGKTEIRLFEVVDFIEDHGKNGFSNLWGPLAVSETDFGNKESAKFLSERLKMAGDWLVNIQEKDGNFPPITNPLSGCQTQVDWPRSAFSGWSLAELGLFLKENKYLEAAKIHLSYIVRHLNEEFLRGIPSFFLLTAAYAGQEALALFRADKGGSYYKTAIDLSQKILNVIGDAEFDAITFQQIAGYFAELAHYENKFLESSVVFSRQAAGFFEDCLKNKRGIDLAVHAELVNLFEKLFWLTQDNAYRVFSMKVSRWLLRYQLLHGPGGIWGPFAESPESDFVYTRGTGKIFEVLASLVEYRENAQKALAWLLAMQYTEENTFFVPQEFCSKIIGGFRHDYFNQEAWIDAAGHFIAGGIKYLASFTGIKGSGAE